MRAAVPAVAPPAPATARRTVAQLASFTLALVLELLFPAAEERGGRTA